MQGGSIARRGAPSLAPGVVHAWQARFGAEPGHLGALLSELPHDERAGAARFAREDLRTRWSFARGLLRRVLASYLGAEPRALAFAIGAHGKPRLDPASDVRFNLAHAGEHVLIAVARGREVGCDVERVDEGRALARLAHEILGPREIDAWQRAGADRRAELFYRAWTAKEAALKAAGVGITIGPGVVEVLAGGGERVVDSVEVAGARYALRELAPRGDAIAAVALEGDIADVVELDAAPLAR
jgi:4'-phosphopantetheinyl transferase